MPDQDNIKCHLFHLTKVVIDSNKKKTLSPSLIYKIYISATNETFFAFFFAIYNTYLIFLRKQD